MTYQDSFVLLAVYLVSFVLIYGYSLVRAHSYIRRSKIVSTNDGVEIFQSFIEKNQVLIPFVKITSIEVDQTLFERPLDLSTLFIYTNSSDDNFELSGLLFDDAKRFAEKVTSEHKLKVK